MNTKHKTRTLSLPAAATVAGIALALGIVSGAAAQNRFELIVYKNTITTDARRIGGKLYVPIADVAHAMGWRLAVKGTRITLQPPIPQTASGGAAMPEGAVNAEIAAGNYKFRANGVVEAAHYDRKYANGMSGAGAADAGAGEKLVVLDCTLTNASAAKEAFCFSRDTFAENTALLDATGTGAQPFLIDVPADVVNPIGASAMPGANVRFALVFKVPAATQAKALVFTIVRYPQYGMKKGTDVRVNLAP